MEMTQTGYDLVVGIDVSKAKLDIVLGSQGSVETIDNTVPAVKKLIQEHITAPLKTLVVVEATGGYESLLVDSLHAARCTLQTSPLQLSIRGVYATLQKVLVGMRKPTQSMPK